MIQRLLGILVRLAPLHPRVNYVNELQTVHYPEFFEFVDQLILLDLHLRRVHFQVIEIALHCIGSQ